MNHRTKINDILIELTHALVEQNYGAERTAPDSLFGNLVQ